MTSRERFECAMARRTPDRVPLDIGGTPLTGMRPRCQERLLDLLGFPGSAVEFGQGVDERILRWAKADFRTVGNILPLPSKHARNISPESNVDCWGVRRDLVDGEMQITESPLRGVSVEDLRSYAWPEGRISDEVLDVLVAQAKELHSQGQYVVVAGHPVFGILELGCWMCGYEEFFIKLALDPDFVWTFFDIVLRIQLEVIDQYYAALGPWIDVTTSGDDFGSQNGPLVSPAMFNAFIAPYFSERIRRTKAVAKCYYWHHTCGSVFKLIDQIIACGVDILNPVQTSAAEMEPRALKERFGDRIVFWGGVDVQQFLPRATPEEVPGRIEELISTLGADGGYIMAPAHQIQDDVPAENIIAWVEAVQRCSPHAEEGRCGETRKESLT